MSPNNQRAHKYSDKSGPKRQPVFLGEANVGKMYDATAKAIIVVDTKQVCNQAHQAFPETNSHLEAWKEITAALVLVGRGCCVDLLR